MWSMHRGWNPIGWNVEFPAVVWHVLTEVLLSVCSALERNYLNWTKFSQSFGLLLKWVSHNRNTVTISLSNMRQVQVALWAWQGRLLCYPGQVKLPCRASSSVIPGQIALLALQFALGWATEVPALGWSNAAAGIRPLGLLPHFPGKIREPRNSLEPLCLLTRWSYVVQVSSTRKAIWPYSIKTSKQHIDRDSPSYCLLQK